MLESDSFWALVGLILFFLLIFSLGVPKKVLGALDNRTDRIKNEIDQAVKSREEAQALLAEYQRKRLEAESEAEAIVEEAKREAKRLTDEAETKLADMVTRRTAAAEAKIAQAEAQAVAEVRGRAADLAASTAAGILRERLTGSASDDMMAKSIATVKARLN